MKNNYAGRGDFEEEIDDSGTENFNRLLFEFTGTIFSSIAPFASALLLTFSNSTDESGFTLLTFKGCKNCQLRSYYHCIVWF